MKEDIEVDHIITRLEWSNKENQFVKVTYKVIRIESTESREGIPLKEFQFSTNIEGGA